MAQPEKDKKDDPPPPPELGAILPDKASTPKDIFAGIDEYQRRIENQWEATRHQYEEKIEKVMKKHKVTQKPSLSQILESDQWAREAFD